MPNGGMRAKCEYIWYTPGLSIASFAITMFERV